MVVIDRKKIATRTSMMLVPAPYAIKTAIRDAEKAYSIHLDGHLQSAMPSRYHCRQRETEIRKE